MFNLASLTNGSFWSNVRFGAFFAGTVALGAMVASWTVQESEEVQRAREIVEDADKKNRLKRWLSFGFGVVALYGTIQTASYIASRADNDGPRGVYRIIKSEDIFSD